MTLARLLLSEARHQSNPVWWMGSLEREWGNWSRWYALAWKELGQRFDRRENGVTPVPATISDKQAMKSLGMAMTLPSELFVGDGSNMAEALAARFERQIREDSDKRVAQMLGLGVRIVESPWMPENAVALVSQPRDLFPPMKFDLELARVDEFGFHMTSRAHMPIAIPRVFLPLDVDSRKPRKLSCRQRKQVEVRVALAKRRERVAKRRRR